LLQTTDIRFWVPLGPRFNPFNYLRNYTFRAMGSRHWGRGISPFDCSCIRFCPNVSVSDLISLGMNGRWKRHQPISDPLPQRSRPSKAFSLVSPTLQSRVSLDEIPLNYEEAAQTGTFRVLSSRLSESSFNQPPQV